MIYRGKNANKGRNNRYVWVECCGPLRPDGPVWLKTSKNTTINVLDKQGLSKSKETKRLLKYEFIILLNLKM